MDNSSFYERIIDTLNMQIQRQDEYIKMLILRTHVSTKVEHLDTKYTDLYHYIQDKLNNIEIESVHNGLDDTPGQTNCISNLIESVLVPDKNNIVFSVLNNNCVKFMYNGNVKYESIISFAANICNFIHNHVIQYINNEEFEELEQKLLNDDQMKDEDIQANLQKTQRYIHNLNNLKLPDVQVRLIKKVFSTFKHK